MIIYIITKKCSVTTNHILPVLFRLCNRGNVKKIRKNVKMENGIKSRGRTSFFCLFLPV